MLMRFVINLNVKKSGGSIACTISPPRASSSYTLKTGPGARKVYPPACILQDVFKGVARFYGHSELDLLGYRFGGRRTSDVVELRYLTAKILLLYYYQKLSVNALARAVGLDHSTIQHGLDQIEAKITLAESTNDKEVTRYFKHIMQEVAKVIVEVVRQASISSSSNDTTYSSGQAGLGQAV